MQVHRRRAGEQRSKRPQLWPDQENWAGPKAGRQEKAAKPGHQRAARVSEPEANQARELRGKR
eukprot:12648916-Alexandrium_andersonii.AAC.1